MAPSAGMTSHEELLFWWWVVGKHVGGRWSFQKSSKYGQITWKYVGIVFNAVLQGICHIHFGLFFARVAKRFETTNLTMFCCLWGDRDSRVRIHGWKVEHKNREVSYKMYLFRKNLQSAELYGDKNQVESFIYQISSVSFSHKSVPILQMQIESIQQCQPWLVQPTRQMVDLRWLVLGWN